jgi:limonene-1,2-epoxide hydrolase
MARPPWFHPIIAPHNGGGNRGQREDAMDAAALLKEFCDAVERRDGAAFAALFTADGVYHDVFYGTFAGRQEIAAMIDDWFHRTARDFRWDMHEPVTDSRTLYARYSFSYTSLLPEASGARVLFEGVAIMTLADGLIASYREVADVGPAFAAMNFPPERSAKLAARRARDLRAAPDFARHLA